MLCENVDAGTQTIISVYPHFLQISEANKLRVFGNAVVQTETTIGKELNSEKINDLLVYTPVKDIIRGALFIRDIPKKYVLTFNDIVAQKLFEEEDIADPEKQESTNSIHSQPLRSSYAQRKSNLKSRKYIMAESADVECQTDLMVRPYILDFDQIAQAYRTMEAQTSATFSPNANIDEVKQSLYTYKMHIGGIVESHGIEKMHGIKEDQEIQESQTIHKFEDNLNKNNDANETFRDIISEVSYEDSPEVIPHDESNTSSNLNVIENVSENDHAESQTEFEKIGAALKQLTSDEIQEICNECCTEAQVLDRIQDWYKEVHFMLEEESDDEKDRISGQNFGKIEAEIFATADDTLNTLEVQLDRMQKRYCPVETSDIEVEVQQTSSHIEKPGVCIGSKFRDQSCSCDCHILEGAPGTNHNQNNCSVDFAKFSQVRKQNYQHAVSIGRNVISSPAVITISCPTSSDLPNEAKHVKTALPIKARACTNRKCNCLHSQGCLHCDQALRIMQEKQNSSSKMECPSHKTTMISQNIQLLTDMDGDYIEDYLKLLEHEDEFTQVEDSDVLIENRQKTENFQKCPCLNVMEIPWDMIIIPELPPQPQQQNMPDDKDRTEEESKEDVEDELEAAANAEIQEVEGDLETDETRDRNKNWRKRPPLKPFQVFEPECEIYNEPYIDRMNRFFGNDDLGLTNECTSRIEMPWDDIELPKQIRIRKNPCQGATTHKVPKDSKRKCGTEYRANIKASQGSCTCEPNNISSQPQIPLHKGISDTCVCPKQNISANRQKNTNSMKESCNSLSAINKSVKGISPRLAAEANSKVPPMKSISAQSRTERIAALLDSCKKEMEPIKDGINQLRARIKELNLPDLTYQEQPQHPYSGVVSSPGYHPILGSDMYGMQSMQMPMCYSPTMMCYPYPPSCMQGMPNIPTGAIGSMSATPSSPHTRGGKCKFEPKYKSKQKKEAKDIISSSNVTTTTTSRSTSPSSEYESQRRHKNTHRNESKNSCAGKGFQPNKNEKVNQSRKQLSPKLTCACGISVSIPPTAITISKNSSKNLNGSDCNQNSKIPRPVANLTSNKSGTEHQGSPIAKINSYAGDKNMHCSVPKPCTSMMMVVCQSTQSENARVSPGLPKNSTCICKKCPNIKNDVDQSVNGAICSPCDQPHNVNFE